MVRTTRTIALKARNSAGLSASVANGLSSTTPVSCSGGILSSGGTLSSWAKVGAKQAVATISATHPILATVVTQRCTDVAETCFFITALWAALLIGVWGREFPKK